MFVRVGLRVEGVRVGSGIHGAGSEFAGLAHEGFQRQRHLARPARSEGEVSLFLALRRLGWVVFR